MSNQRTLADPRLTELLQELLSEESLPPLDRWFSTLSKTRRWAVSDQKKLWDSLRRALTRGYGLLPSAATPEVTAWAGFRVALRGRAEEWATRADLGVSAVATPVQAGIPGWLTAALEDRCQRSGWSPEDRNRFLILQEAGPPVYVRFRFGAEGEACEARLSQTKVVEPSEVEGIFRLSGLQGLQSAGDWKNGLVEIQDAASQLSLARLDLRPGQRVWDVCAGRGGKTLLAAGELRGKGAMVATDVAEMKLKTLKDRVRRSGWQNIRLLSWDGRTLPNFRVEVAGRGGFDRVIVDAPCSASGTWRRDPEGRFRLTPRSLKELGSHQARLVRLGWEALKPGGKLAYVTCSWLPGENEDVIRSLITETGARLVHQELLGLPAFDANTLFTAILEKN